MNLFQNSPPPARKLSAGAKLVAIKESFEKKNFYRPSTSKRLAEKTTPSINHFCNPYIH